MTTENLSIEQQNHLSGQTTWCPYPFHYLMVTPNLDVRPCCRYNSAKEDGPLQTDTLKNINAILHGNTFSKVRSQMMNNEAPAGCAACFTEERSQILSLRQKTILEKSLPLNNATQLTSMEIGVGRLCNLKCRTCNSQYSTKWDADELALGWQTTPYAQKKEADLENFPIELFAKMEELKITGGEPFLSRSFEKFLENFKSSSHAANCNLEVFTNCTIVPSKNVMLLLNSFKSCRISLSLDGIGIKNDYIRHPSQWSRVLSVCDTWIKWKNENQKNSLWIANTVCILNISDCFSFIDWAEKTFGKEIKIVFQILHGPSYLSVLSMPNNLKKMILHHLESQIESSLRHISNDKNIRNIHKILNLLRTPETSTHKNRIYEFLEQTQKIDSLRNENYQKCFPELAQWISECK